MLPNEKIICEPRKSEFYEHFESNSEKNRAKLGPGCFLRLNLDLGEILLVKR